MANHTNHGPETCHVCACLEIERQMQLRAEAEANLVAADANVVRLRAALIRYGNSYGCACQAADARFCYIVRYDVDPADDDLDDGRCECLCHRWRECDEC